ncbi:FMN-dependent oxidoreductase (nitrilotriacetate monooxygenase family) [Humitalea rosea]|uniref:FMN-dependent oxidoreductase (Nitrilotriacetate monooxygenase family) n=1 Tax=Humitalea rosea TaxID=990373 RepID=A0A2W7I7R2_9PROT|nr:LLM class flavin-dependent oxidoreductase [Humitalea rosea]PZW42981.1 FMN-dependent oxidoreductase (nitrilotriacetate monooxygenase family) [Humitalea rosea]
MPAERRMHLAFSAHLSGAHPAGWRHPSTEDGSDVSIAAYRRLARIAEAGLFDLFFMADTPALRIDNLESWSRFPLFTNVLEPLTALSALAGATEHIGLGGTATTSFNEPFNVARQFASLDHVSGGRAAWNVVTTANNYAAGNFGHAPLAPHAERYDRAREFVALVKKFWNTWEDDAFVYDREAGRFYDPAKLHPVLHEGKHFQIKGGLNLERTPQGHPVIIQAGASDDGKALAAETAEVVFASANTLEKAQAYYSDVKGRMAAFGRERDELCVLAGMPVVVGESEQEAEDKHQTLQALLHPAVARQRLGMDLETDLSDLPYDEPIPESRIPSKANLHTAYFAEIVRMIREEKLTLRQIAQRYERGTRTLRGTPKHVADRLEEWFTGGACDGFMLILHLQPAGLEDFVRLVVPELQRRHLFRTEYTGRTLRDHLGLRRPPFRAPSLAKAAE